MYNVLLTTLLAFVFVTSYFLTKSCWTKILLKEEKKKKKEMLKISMKHAVDNYMRKMAKHDVLWEKIGSLCDKLVEDEKQWNELVRTIYAYENSTIRNLHTFEDLKKKEHDLIVSIEYTRKRIEGLLKEGTEAKKILDEARIKAESESEKYYEETGERNNDFWWNSEIYDSEYSKILLEDLLNRKPKKDGE